MILPGDGGARAVVVPVFIKGMLVCGVDIAGCHSSANSHVPPKERHDPKRNRTANGSIRSSLAGGNCVAE
jgi:hypothetical protein